MDRVFSVRYSCDASYVLSGSDDTNIRLWKAKASEQLGVVSRKSMSNLLYLFYEYVVTSKFAWNEGVLKVGLGCLMCSCCQGRNKGMLI